MSFRTPRLRGAVPALLLAGGFLLSCGLGARAGGILPDRDNRILIRGQFSDPSPSLLLLFSAAPLRGADGRPVTRFSAAQLSQLKTGNEVLALRVYGKPATRPGQFEYSFGSGNDGRMPWNAGPDFRWADWERLSPDIWDNVCIVPLPASGSTVPSSVVITDLALFKGGKVLYDSRPRRSYPNGRPIDVSLPPTSLTPQPGWFPVLNLSGRMEHFRREYYELGASRILRLAYADLGQTEKRKYATRGTAWCSEFSSYVYRQCGIMTPDPNRSDVHWKSMREFFERNGQVYPAREVASWPDERKRALIRPGSFVSILLGKSTHSIIFTNWVVPRAGGPITTYVGVSGNNRGMVWPHAPMKLPTAEALRGMSPEQLRDYDQKVYFAVPRE